jgi:hypothetical protein
VERQIACGRKERALRPAVDIVDFVAVLLVADPLDEIVFDNALDDAALSIIDGTVGSRLA